MSVFLLDIAKSEAVNIWERHNAYRVTVIGMINKKNVHCNWIVRRSLPVTIAFLKNSKEFNVLGLQLLIKLKNAHLLGADI